jgi:hypothetical protein
MKKFSEIGNKMETKKYHEKTKNVVYDIIKENISVNLSGKEGLITEKVNVKLTGVDKLIEKINNYIKKKVNEEKIKTLLSIKSAIATGTLSLEKINEEIECSEVSDEEMYDDEDKKKKEYTNDGIVDDFDEDEDETEVDVIIDIPEKDLKA